MTQQYLLRFLAERNIKTVLNESSSRNMRKQFAPTPLAVIVTNYFLCLQGFLSLIILSNQFEFSASAKYKYFNHTKSTTELLLATHYSSNYYNYHKIGSKWRNVQNVFIYNGAVNRFVNYYNHRWRSQDEEQYKELNGKVLKVLIHKVSTYLLRSIHADIVFC